MKVDQFLAYAQRLVVHAEYRRNLSGAAAVALQSIDLIEKDLDLLQVVALNILEAVGPDAGFGGIADRIAARITFNGGHPLDYRVDFGAIEVVDVVIGRADGGVAFHNFVARILVRPCRVAAVAMRHTEDRVHAHVAMRIDRHTSVHRIEGELGWIDPAAAKEG